MAYADQLSDLDVWRADVTLLIEGIPFLFGTREGLTFTPSDINDPISPMTSVAAIDPSSIKLERAELDYDAGWVGPTSASVRIFIDDRWNKYFEKRRTPSTRILSDISAVATVFGVSNGNGFATGDIAYINREAMRITSATATTLNVVRNHMSLPITEDASHVAGSRISIAPTHLLARPCELRLWLGDGVDNKRHTFLYLSAPPVYNKEEGAWDLQFDDAMRLFDRKLHVGLRGAEVISHLQAGTPTLVRFTPDDSTELVNITNNGDLMVEWPGDFEPHHSIMPINSLGVGVLNDAAVALTDWRGGGNGRSPNTVTFMRRVYNLSRDPLYAALVCMLSDRGDLANDATYDIMFGRTASGASATNRLSIDQTEIRFGAAIPAALVDVAGIEAQAEPVDGWNFILGADGKEESLLVVLEEAAFARGGYWIFRDSKLTFRLYDASYAGDTFQNIINESHILRDTEIKIADDESEVVHTFNIKCNYGRQSRFYTDVTAYYLEEKETFRDIKGTRDIERKTLLVSVQGLERSKLFVGDQASFITVPELQLRLDRIFARRARGVRKYRIALPWRYSEMHPGDRIKVTSGQLIDFAGNTLSNFSLEVTAVERDFSNGMVIIDTQEVWVGKYISPTGLVTSWDGGTNTVTLDSTTPKFGGAASPANFFAAGWKVLLLDATRATAANPRYETRSALLTVDSIPSATEVRFTGSPSFTPAADDLLVLADYDDSDSVVLNDAQGSSQRDYAFMCDTNLRLGATPDDPHEWG